MPFFQPKLVLNCPNPTRRRPNWAKTAQTHKLVDRDVFKFNSALETKDLLSLSSIFYFTSILDVFVTFLERFFDVFVMSNVVL